MFIYLLLFSFINFMNKVESHSDAWPKIWGPGLQPHKFVMPARYIFLETEKKHESNKSKILQDKFKISIEGISKQNKPCRIWSNTLDRKNGSLIVRYKVYDDVCSNFKLNIRDEYEQQVFKEVHQDRFYSDSCYCPQDVSIKEFLESWQCSELPPQIIEDFKPFQVIDWDLIRPQVIKQFDKPHSVSLCHYIIKDNKVYRKCYGKYVGFNMFSDNILLSLTRKVKMPDLEFFVNLGDWPLSSDNLKEKYPIFSWCGSNDSYDIVMPTYELTESALENMGRVMLDILSVQGNVKGVWEEREPKLFWRGRDSNRHRLNLITLARENPDLFNASLTNFFFYRDEEHIYGPKTEHVSFFSFFDYKYQLAIDGTVASYRTPFLFGGGSLVFKQHSKYYEHFYRGLKPNVHYIPVKEDLSDLVEKIQWAKKNDDQAKVIAQNGQDFVNENLLPKNVFCYYLHLFNNLHNVIKSNVEVLEEMEHVEQMKSITCDCLPNDSLKKDEL